MFPLIIALIAVCRASDASATLPSFSSVYDEVSGVLVAMEDTVAALSSDGIKRQMSRIKQLNRELDSAIDGFIAASFDERRGSVYRLTQDAYELKNSLIELFDKFKDATWCVRGLHDMTVELGRIPLQDDPDTSRLIENLTDPLGQVQQIGDDEGALKLLEELDLVYEDLRRLTLSFGIADSATAASLRKGARAAPSQRKYQAAVTALVKGALVLIDLTERALDFASESMEEVYDNEALVKQTSEHRLALVDHLLSLID